MKKITILLLLLTILGSCKKEKIKVYPDFVGLWQANTVSNNELNIKSNGRSTYEEKTFDSELSYRGWFRIKDKKELKIGLKKFDIDLFPKATEYGEKIMVLDGIIYYLQ